MYNIRYSGYFNIYFLFKKIFINNPYIKILDLLKKMSSYATGRQVIFSVYNYICLLLWVIYNFITLQISKYNNEKNFKTKCHWRFRLVCVVTIVYFYIDSM